VYNLHIVYFFCIENALQCLALTERAIFYRKRFNDSQMKKTTVTHDNVKKYFI